MDRSVYRELVDVGLNLARMRIELALLRWRREERANPHWHLQPRLPAGDPHGGRWTNTVLPLIGQLLARAPQAVRALRALAQGVRNWLRRPPRRWSGRQLEETEFDRETGRIGKPSERRPQHLHLRFRSFREFKRFLGEAGNGMEWHHIVEQRLADNGRFTPEEIHNTDNIVSLPREVHICVNAEMSRIQNHTNGNTLRKWLESMPFADQFDAGLDVIRDCLDKLGRSQ